MNLDLFCKHLFSYNRQNLAPIQPSQNDPKLGLPRVQFWVSMFFLTGEDQIVNCQSLGNDNLMEPIDCVRAIVAVTVS